MKHTCFGYFDNRNYMSALRPDEVRVIYLWKCPGKSTMSLVLSDHRDTLTSTDCQYDINEEIDSNTESNSDS